MKFDYSDIIGRLAGEEVSPTGGLSEMQIKEIEAYYHVRFPLSLRELYMQMNPPYVRWNDFSPTNVELIKKQILWPLEGMLFDMRENHFWYDGWGERPPTVQEAQKICIKKFPELPQLIPINGYRYIPYLEGIDDPPVLSVHQMDIIYYGTNLEQYLMIENGLLPWEVIRDSKQIPVPFWLEED